MTVAEFNALTEPDAAAELAAVCGAASWGRRLLDQRPFGTVDDVRRAALDAWRTLGREDWLEAVSHHPRIGSAVAAHPTGARAQSWSSSEQAGARATDDATRRHFTELSETYERTFDRPFIIYATGLGLHDMAAALSQRLGNDADTELRVTADELRRITLLRVDKLFASP